MISRNLYILLLLVVLSCSNGSNSESVMKVNLKSESVIQEQEVGNNIEQEAEDFIVIPLNQIYLGKTIDFINKKQYAESSSRIIMDFIVQDSLIIYANNDKKTIECYNINSKSITTITRFFPDNESKTDYPIAKMFISKNDLYVSSYFFSLKFNLTDKIWSLINNRGFGKGSIHLIKVTDKSEIVSFQSFGKINDYVSEYMFSTGWDAVKDKSSNNTYMVFSGEEGIPFYSSKNNQEKLIGELLNGKIDINDCDDIDIVYSDNSKVVFVAKFFLISQQDDVVVTYDVANNIILSTKVLDTKFHSETHHGDPGVFYTGATYKIFGDKLWRLRTTLGGICFENWNVKDIIGQYHE